MAIFASTRAIGYPVAFDASAEDRETRRFAAAAEAAFATAKRRISLRSVMTAIVITLVFGAITLVLWEGARDVIAGRMSGGTITAFVLAAIPANALITAGLSGPAPRYQARLAWLLVLAPALVAGPALVLSRSAGRAGGRAAAPSA